MQSIANANVKANLFINMTLLLSLFPPLRLAFVAFLSFAVAFHHVNTLYCVRTSLSCSAHCVNAGMCGAITASLLFSRARDKAKNIDDL